MTSINNRSLYTCLFFSLRDNLTSAFTNSLLWSNFANFGFATLREMLLVVLTKRSQLFIFSKQYQTFFKTYQCSKVHGTKYVTNFFCKIDQIHLF